MERFKLIPAVYLILLKEDKVLLLKRKNTDWNDGKYSLVAGHLDGNEPATIALAREAKEEVGITIHPDNLQFAYLVHKKFDKERMDIFFTISDWEGDVENKEPEKCSEILWASVDNLPEAIIPEVKEVIKNYLRGNSYSEFGWEGK